VSNVKGGFNSIVRQAQKMQSRLTKLQEELEQRTVEAVVSGGAVTISVNGKREVVGLSIAKDAVDPEDIESLCEMLTVAFNEAMQNVSDMIETETNKITGGISMPGML
jgi:DNA-binding YbaB/EbfC family protein